jgi:Siroheme synthase (precorrin-2 oxidase/ferrochelatase domain)
VAISTEGRSPLFARHLREELEELIPQEYGQLVEGLGRMRDHIKTLVEDTNTRQSVYKLLLQPDILNLLRNNQEEMARERIEACISSWQD